MNPPLAGLSIQGAVIKPRINIVGHHFLLSFQLRHSG